MKEMKMAKITEEEFTKLYENFYQDVFRVAFSYLRKKEDAENVVQETFLRLFRKPPRESKKTKSWLLKVAVNLSLDMLRKRKKERQAIQSLENPKEETFSSSREDLLDIVSRLPENYKKTIVLFYCGEETIEEIGKTLGLSSSTVKKRLERGRK